MRDDERTPLSRAKLQQEIVEGEKYACISSIIPVLFVTLLAVGFTAVIANLRSVATSLFWVFLVIGALPFWVGDAVLIYRAWKALKRYRKDLGRDFVVIETDTVKELTEESELHQSGRMAYRDKAYVVYLEKHGRCVIGSTLWNILKVGDEVYVVVTKHAGTGVYGVYSARTHRIVDN